MDAGRVGRDQRPAGMEAVTSHELVIRLGRAFDVRIPARFNDNGHPTGGAFLADVREIAVTFNDRESAEAAQREAVVFVRAVHDAGGEDCRPVVAGEVIGEQPREIAGG